MPKSDEGVSLGVRRSPERRSCNRDGGERGEELAAVAASSLAPGGADRVALPPRCPIVNPLARHGGNQVPQAPVMMDVLTPYPLPENPHYALPKRLIPRPGNGQPG